MRLGLASRLGSMLAAITLLAAVAPPPAAAAAMSVEFDKDNYAREMTLYFHGITDAAGSRTVRISCNGGVDTSDRVPFATTLLVSLDLPGCEGYGLKTVDVQVDEADDTPVFWGQVRPGINPKMTIDRPLPAITGHAFTFRPQYPDDYALPAGSVCRYEFRWGNDRSLRQNDYDETFGALGFDANAVNGNCPAWTFTLPWVPYRQFELFLSVGTIDGYESSWHDHYHVVFTAAADGTGRLISSSNLPLVQVLPSTYTPVVGEPVTYTRYLIGGASAGSSSTWNAWQGSDPDVNHWYKSGGSTFTITPWEPGNVTVSWQRGGERLFYGMYDPPVRRRDGYRPNTTAPAQRIGTGTLGTQVPVTITWDGSDRGWGIDRFQLERSVDGGAWKRILSKKVRELAQSITPGHAYRYRVRAIDKYGNVGYWDYGPTFRPRVVADGASSVVYAGAWTVALDPTAIGGVLHEADAARARATLSFTGRDVAWIAERGPGHGRAMVYLDGRHVATVDLASSVDLPARIVYRKHWSAAGSHTLRVVLEGTAGRPTVGVDAFVVLR